MLLLFYQLQKIKSQIINLDNVILIFAHDWKSHDIKVWTVVEIENFLNTYKNIRYKCTRTNNKAEIILSEEQIEVITLCQRQIDFMKNDTEKNSNIIKIIIVQGRARSSKSNIMNKTMELLINNFGT